MKITVETTIQSTISQVWECFTQPAHIIHWNFASEDWHCPSATNDLKPGSRFIWRMEAQDGSTGFDFGGIYLQIETEKYISYRMDDGREVHIRFSATGNTTTITETFDAETINTEDRQKTGWQAILNHFKSYVESITE